MNHPGNPSLPVVTRSVAFRDFVVFQVKLALDGVKDAVLMSLSVIAIVIDMIAGGGRRPRRFYAVIRLCSRFDRWLRLHSTKGFAETGELLWPDQPGTGAGIGERRMLGSDADTLIERVEDLARRESKSAERWLDDMIERQRRAGGRMREAPGRETTDYDRDLEDFDRDLRSRGR
ncbi:MAG: hypothetical protein OXR82_00840 [Gammaproteobacteria bacterium]|nr:hypothetical protein [Gammaproteobacteria bacterium]MDE0256918.1 hypothetical protein [Gammaproteobacteria bacterium]